PMTSASICEAQPGSPGPVVIDIPTVFPGSLQGLFELGDVPADFLDKCRAGKYCVVVRTANFPDGEVRGQLHYLGALGSFAPINRLQQVPPPPMSAGFGYNHTTPNATLDSLSTTVGINGISPISVQVRIGPPGMSGPVLADLLPTAVAGVYRRTYAISPSQLTDFVQNRLYINVSTAAYPNGEIRGQLKTNLRKGYAFDLCGPQMVPPASTAALGTGVFSVDQADCYMNYRLLTDRLSTPLAGGDIRQGATGQNGPALYPLSPQEPLLRGEGAIKAGEGVLIENGGAYFVLRTADFPEGEIRGQIRRGIGCPPISSVADAGGWMQTVELSPVPFGPVLRVRWQSEQGWQGHLVLRGVLGQPLISQTVVAAAGLQEAVLPTEGLPAGIYW
ncbi:MAG TPA: CHRD domain-containing protein, partial [Myxococcota bacterium]|nr:CHRD domain-containing protein [Myxococcota bacterium]